MKSESLLQIYYIVAEVEFGCAMYESHLSLFALVLKFSPFDGAYVVLAVVNHLSRLNHRHSVVRRSKTLEKCH